MISLFKSQTACNIKYILSINLLSAAKQGLIIAAKLLKYAGGYHVSLT